MTEQYHACEQATEMRDTPICTAWHQAGHAIDSCEEDEHAFLWAGNGEYESMVNFCPFCGYKAKRSAVDQDEWEKIMEAAAEAKGCEHG